MVLRRTLPLLALAAFVVSAQAQVTTPKQFFGHEVCEDYWLANYEQLTAYWQKLDKESSRMMLQSIGKTEEGREQYMAIISDPANLKSLQKHRTTSRKFAMARDFKDNLDAEKLAKTAKTVVWIDGGLHATEVLGAQQLLETTYQLVSRNDPENKRILKDVIILVVHANPDGMDLVSNWYMRKTDPKTRSLAGVPRLYQKYIGHDNNRDFYANNMSETRNMNRILYKEWSPQILYNHHQSAPAGTVMFIPPFRNPFSYHVDPIIQVATDTVAMHMHTRLIVQGLGGTVMRNAANYSTWWNGGLRTTTYYHNMIGILTETFGSPNPTMIPFLNNRQVPTTDIPKPVEPGEWHLRDSLRYEVEANYAILDFASRYRERLLLDTYQAAKNAIDRGNKDTWTRYSSRVMALGADAIKKPELRDARMYVLPADQRDPGSMRWFVDRLMDCGVEVEQLTQAATVNGKNCPAGSYVIPCNQAYRPQILDMFEFQDHPNDFQFPGGPPIPPYDNAGYTLAFQMGIEFERVLDPVSLETKAVIGGQRVTTFANLTEWQSFHDLDSYKIVNAALHAGTEVFLRGDGASGRGFLHTGPTTPRQVGKPRIALWDRYGGSMTSGWTRWVFEQFGFDFQLVFPPDFEKGNLKDKFDVIVLPSGAIPGAVREGGGGPGGGGEPQSNDQTIPAEWRARMGSMNAKAIAELKTFAENGGHIIAIGDSAQNLLRPFGLPLESALTELGPDGTARRLPNTKFYVPGSVLRIQLLLSSGLTRGLNDYVDSMFDNSPAFRWTTPTPPPDSTVAVFDTAKPLRSGWAWGQEILKDTIAIADVPLGKGRVVLFGPEVLFRGQPTQTFKLVFNAILRSGAK